MRRLPHHGWGHRTVRSAVRTPMVQLLSGWPGSSHPDLNRRPPGDRAATEPSAMPAHPTRTAPPAPATPHAPGLTPFGYAEPWGVRHCRTYTIVLSAQYRYGADNSLSRGCIRPDDGPTDRSMRTIDELDVQGYRHARAISIARSPLCPARSARAAQLTAPEVPTRRPDPHGASLKCRTTR